MRKYHQLEPVCLNCKQNPGCLYSEYASGKFCSKLCARSFSTKERRKEINAKVRLKLKGDHFSGRRVFHDLYGQGVITLYNGLVVVVDFVTGMQGKFRVDGPGAHPTGGLDFVATEL